MLPESRFKPGVSRRVHLFAAPFLWTLVGLMLMFRGWRWLGDNPHILILLAAFTLGTLKSVLLLDHITRRAIHRISHFNDNTCLGAVYSWKSWLMVLVMITAGMMARYFWKPGPGLGALYLAIGWSLLFSSRLGWLSFRKEVDKAA